jgi:hypothetical protein
MLEDGIITTSWNDSSEEQEGQTKNTLAWDVNKTLFTLIFRANTNKHLSDLLQIHSKFTQAEAYAVEEGQGLSDAEILGVQLAFNNSILINDETNDFQLYQNTPNPFENETVIGFDLPEEGEATLTIYDVSGKILNVVTGNFLKGYNRIRIKGNDLQGSGVLYYRLESLTGTATKKMILQ